MKVKSIWKGKKWVLNVLTLVFVGLGFLTLSALKKGEGVWGFFVHKLISKQAIYSLPPEMIGLYKTNKSALEELSIVPDKRRYLFTLEQYRHYIDLDHWIESTEEKLPHNFNEAVVRYANIRLYDENNALVYSKKSEDAIIDDYLREQIVNIYKSAIRFNENAANTYEEVVNVPYNGIFKVSTSIFFEDKFSEFGILPYNLFTYTNKLTSAFKDKNVERVVKLSGEICHYIGDACVPLHTTVNYNGQFTDQLGIHAFWETRIPELFALDQYSFWIGKAEYITDLDAYIWSLVYDSHDLVESVLKIEKELSKEVSSDKQYCIDLRNGYTVRTECEDFARLYQDKMGGMVEERLKTAISATASIWYTCWVNAGKPKLNEYYVQIDESISDSLKAAEKKFNNKRIEIHN